MALAKRSKAGHGMESGAGMTRGPKPKPTALRLLFGQPHHKTVRQDEAHPVTIERWTDPPADLSRDAAEVWRLKAPSFIRLGLLTEADIDAFASWCDAYVQYRTAMRELDKLREQSGAGAFLHKTKDGNVIQSPLIGIANRARLDMNRLCAEFGMTPSSRTRISTGKPNKGDDGW